jgi:hypothetical protein
MSQKLLVTAILYGNGWADAVITPKTKNIGNYLTKNWTCLKNGWHWGILKIYIEDLELFKKVEKIIKEVVEKTGQKFPQNVCIEKWKRETANEQS